jgi:hypothetical protein
MPADAYVDRDAVGFDLMRLHRSREGMDTILMSFIVHRFTPNFKGTMIHPTGCAANPPTMTPEACDVPTLDLWTPAPSDEVSGPITGLGAYLRWQGCPARPAQ